MMSNKRVLYLMALVLVLTLLLTGCGGTQSTGPGIPEAQSVIQAYGEAELTAQPDLAKVSLAIETRSNSAEDAVEENARLANSVREALLDFGIAEDKLVTGSYRLFSYRERVGDMPFTEEEIVFFQATNEIIVTTADLETVGEIIDLAVRAGANNINYINFELEDPQEMMMMALAAATEQASRKAEAIAEGAGETITGLMSVREERTEYMPFRFQEDMLREEMAMGAATPITPDEVTVRAAVIAEFTF
jgi:uncharacterized protein